MVTLIILVMIFNYITTATCVFEERRRKAGNCEGLVKPFKSRYDKLEGSDARDYRRQTKIFTIAIIAAHKAGII